MKENILKTLNVLIFGEYGLYVLLKVALMLAAFFGWVAIIGLILADWRAGMDPYGGLILTVDMVICFTSAILGFCTAVIVHGSVKLAIVKLIETHRIKKMIFNKSTEKNAVNTWRF